MLWKFLANIHQKERVFLLKMLLNQMVSAISLCIVLMCLKGGYHLRHLLNCCHHFHFHLSPASPEISDTSFTTEEKQRFQTRYEEGFDITTDCRYNQWLQKNHHEAISERCQLQFSPLNPEDSLRSSRRGIGTRSGWNRRWVWSSSEDSSTPHLSQRLKLDQFLNYPCQKETWWSKGSH